jgi:hypothetical protein
MKSVSAFRASPVFIGVFVSLFSAAPAFAGSIVINQAMPNSSLRYQDDAGQSQDLQVSWSDLQLISKVKTFLVAKHGENGRGLPYMIDRTTQSVNVLVDRATASYETVTFAQLQGQ